MTVRELISLLQDYPDDLRVVVNGYEDGYDDLSPRQLSVMKVGLDTGKYDWQGDHQEVDFLSADRATAAEVVEALVLRRTSN